MKPWLVYSIFYGAVLGGAALGIALVHKMFPDIPKSRREEFFDAAEAELGGPKDPDDFWKEVAPALVSSDADWCGGFILAKLHSVGLGTEIVWQVGRGFLFRLPQTRVPVKGDLVYFDQPNQHHAIFERFSSDGANVHTIDANQVGETVARRVRPRADVTAFFSIEPLILGVPTV